eukprot:10224477-Alexandrium_andersonii.AAC.1
MSSWRVSPSAGRTPVSSSAARPTSLPPPLRSWRGSRSGDWRSCGLILRVQMTSAGPRRWRSEWPSPSTATPSSSSRAPR